MAELHTESTAKTGTASWQVGHEAVDSFISRSLFWPQWLTPSRRVTTEQILNTAYRHLERLRAAADATNFRLNRYQPVILTMTARELASKANLDSQWHHALVRAAELPVSLAHSTTGRTDQDRAAIASLAWDRINEVLGEQVWQAAAERLVGCWHRAPLRAGEPWQLIHHDPATYRHEFANAALSIAQQIAMHHALNGVWLVMEPSLLARGLKNPYADLVRLERWGYVVLGPDGQKTTVLAGGRTQEVPRFVIAQLIDPDEGIRRTKRH